MKLFNLQELLKSKKGEKIMVYIMLGIIIIFGSIITGSFIALALNKGF